MRVKPRLEIDGKRRAVSVLSLGVTFGLIAAGIVYSLWKTKGEPEPDWPADEGPEGARRHVDALTGGKAV